VYFHVRRGELGQWTVVHVVGEIDLATAPQFRRELISAAAAASALAVDLTECDLIDSVGLGLTLGAARRVGEAGGRFAVIAGDNIRRTFARCRLDEILDIVDDAASLDPVAHP
jgi:anti-anti-sigma factor